MSKLMKCLPLALVLATGLAAQAQAAPAAKPTAAKPAQRFSIDTPIGDLMDDPQARAVVLRHFPGIDKNNHYVMIEDMSIRQLAPMSQGKLTPEALAKIDGELAAIQ